MFRETFFWSAILSIPANIWLCATFPGNGNMIHLMTSGAYLLLGLPCFPLTAHFVFGEAGRGQKASSRFVDCLQILNVVCLLLLTIGAGSGATILVKLTCRLISAFALVN
jgi:hypothetical protein